MFESLGERLQNALHKMKGYGKINEENISEMMREIRLALLEADVNYTVVKEFTNDVKEKALGEEVQKSLKPGEVFVKIVKDELTNLLGGEAKALNLSGNPAILMLVGLQGSGKTTAIGKLSNLLRKKHAKKPLMVACDVYRPAAIDQLKQIGKQLNIEVYDEGKKDPVEISNNAIKYAKENGFDYVLIDCPAGIEQGFKNAVAGADRAIVVTTAEISAIRDADRIIGLLESSEIKNPELIVNRLRPNMVKKGEMMDVDDDMVEATCLEFFNLMLQQCLACHFYQCFGSVICQWTQAGTKTCRKYHCVHDIKYLKSNAYSCSLFFIKTNRCLEVVHPHTTVLIHHSIREMFYPVAENEESRVACQH